MSKSLRIVHCFRSPVGGIFRHVRDLVAAQAAAGHQVGIICDSSTGGPLEEKYFDEIGHLLALGVERLPIQRQIGPRDVAVFWRTFRLVRKLRPDVLHGHGAKGGSLARVFGSLLRALRYRVARIYSPHGGVLHYDPEKLSGRVLFFLERMLERFTDHILFVSDHERRAYASKIGKPRTASSLVHNGLRDAEFEPVVPARDASDLLYLGMMRDLKGPDLFIDAIARTQDTLGRRLTAHMVGDGADLPSYREQAARLGLADQITFLPPMPAREAFALGRVIVVPSRAEALPYVVLEALAAAKPMIATNVGGIPEIFGPGSPALVEPDAARIAEGMVKALNDEDAYAALMPSEADLKRRFGSEVMAREVERAYLLARGEAGQPLGSPIVESSRVP